ncbi:peptide/nickel transport system permease protein [Pilibacter termitis]|jgi:peptide/nickel transport system permease protein|uniref:Peptide/nickel transport system permease protein n=1 Tax=Pilibacter termitis TaxID=263852 RepID=A0A1T4P7E6_9ENTE|nr:ABC transporter permease [Pilibacter termitis]SJZ87495.1 peptide/nickel transport system permease protein [Pilibacter termitis]
MSKKIKKASNSSQTEEQTEVSQPPMGFKMIWREFTKDKFAMGSLILLVLLLVGIFVGAMMFNQESVTTVSIFDKYAPPGAEKSEFAGETFLLGADEGGRDVLGLLLIGARNSIMIGFAITITTSLIGLFVGIVSGYFGGLVDTILMRIVDFVLILPITMIIIVLVSVIPDYNPVTFVGVLSLFYWVGKARLFRSVTLSEVRRDYVSASKIMGTSTMKIIFREVTPNLSSLIITNLTMNFAGNIGIETTLTYLGFGLPPKFPSLGTLIAYAADGTVLQEYLWVWLPASILIVVMMLSINYVGNAIKRSADARQRLG